jgi:hypothetical protein
MYNLSQSRIKTNKFNDSVKTMFYSLFDETSPTLKYVIPLPVRDHAPYAKTFNGT